MKGKKFTAIFLSVVALIILTAALSGVAKNGREASWSDNARDAKADYVYMRALEYMATDSVDKTQAMIDYAYSLAPSDRYLASLDASMTIKLFSIDSPQFADRYRRLYDNYMLNPSDRYLGEEILDIAIKIHKYNDATAILEQLDSVFNTEPGYAVQLASAYMIDGMMGDSLAVKKAIGIYDRLERGMGKSLGLSSYRVRSLDLIHDTVAIERELASLMSEFPDDPEVFHYAGSIYHKMMRDSIAESCYKRASQVDPDYDGATGDLANLYLEQGDTINFKKTALTALKSPNIDPELKYAMMSDFLRTFSGEPKSVAEGESELADILEANPGDGVMHGLAGTFYGVNKNTERAIEELSYAVSLNPTDVRLWTLYVMYLDHEERQAESLEAVKKMAELFPDNVNYPLLASAKMQAMGNNREALDYLLAFDTSSLPNKESLSTLTASIGDIYQTVDSLERADEYYEKAISINPSNFTAYNNSAYMIAEHGGDLDKATRYARYAILASPHSPTFLDTYAWVLFKTKDYAGARTNIDQALTDYIDIINRQMGDSTAMADQAVADEEMADDTIVDAVVDEVAFVPDDPSLSLVDRAIRQKDTIGVELLEHAGDIYFMDGHPDEAIKLWQAALDVAPETRDTAVLKKKVKNKTFFYE